MNIWKIDKRKKNYQIKCIKNFWQSFVKNLISLLPVYFILILVILIFYNIKLFQEGLKFQYVESPKNTQKHIDHKDRKHLNFSQLSNKELKQLKTVELASKSFKQNNYQRLPSSIFEESDSEETSRKKMNNNYLLNSERPQTQSYAFPTQQQESAKKPQTAQTEQKSPISKKLYKISSMATNTMTPYLAKQSDQSSMQLNHRSLYDPRASFFLQCISHQKLEHDKQQSYFKINDFYEECQKESTVICEENNSISKELNDIEAQWKHYAFQLKTKEIDGKTTSNFSSFTEQREFKRMLIQYLLRQLNHDTKLMIMKKYMDNYEKNPDTVIPVQYNYKNMPNMEAFLTKNALQSEQATIKHKWFKQNKLPKQRKTDIYEQYLKTSGQLATKIKHTSELIKRTNELIRSTNPKP